APLSHSPSHCTFRSLRNRTRSSRPRSGSNSLLVRVKQGTIERIVRLTNSNTLGPERFAVHDSRLQRRTAQKWPPMFGQCCKVGSALIRNPYERWLKEETFPRSLRQR